MTFVEALLSARSRLDAELACARPDNDGAYVWSNGTVSVVPRRDVPPPGGLPPSSTAFAVRVFQRDGTAASLWFERKLVTKQAF